MALTDKMIADFKAAYPAARSARAAAIAAGWTQSEADHHSTTVVVALGLRRKTCGSGRGSDPSVTAFEEYARAYPCSDEKERARLCTAAASRLRKAANMGGAS